LTRTRCGNGPHCAVGYRAPCGPLPLRVGHLHRRRQKMKRRLIVAATILLVGALLFAGSFWPFIRYAVWGAPQMERAMVCAVGKKWSCSQDAITLQSQGAPNYRFVGCGHDEMYFCKMPGQGCLIKNGDVDRASDHLRLTGCVND
jgi:hypothetical protein